MAEIPFFSISAVIADQVVKEADVHLLGIETTGNERLMLRLQGGGGRGERGAGPLSKDGRWNSAWLRR